MPWRSAVLVGALALASSYPTGAAERFSLTGTLKGLDYEAVELRRTGDNHLFLFGKVNGRKRSCLVDTGWSFSAVSTNTAARLPETNLVRELTLGGVTLTNETVVVRDMRVNGQPTSYDVVLGADFLLRHHAVLDVVGRRLYLRRTPLPEATRAALEHALRQAGWADVPLQCREPLAFTCAAQVNGGAVKLLVDSGATWSCLDARVAETLAVRVAPSAHRIMGPAASGQRIFAVADLPGWQLGERRLRETSVAVFSLAAWGLGPEGKLFPDVGGILGSADLFRTTAIIDCGGLKLWLRARP